MYCVKYVYETYLPGDTSPLFTTEPDYSMQFETLDEVKQFCENHNKEHKNEYPKLHWHLMTEGDIKAMKEEQETFDC